MTKKPLAFNFIPLILMGIAISFYFQVGILLDLPFTDFYKIHRHITLPNWITISLLTISAIAIYRGHRLAKFLMPVTVFMVCWNNYLVASYGNNFSTLETLFGSLCFPVLFVPLYTRKNQKLLSDKKHHWWQRAHRRQHVAHVSVNPFRSSSFNSKTYDVSKSGLFIQLDDVAWAQLPKLGERVNVSITLDTLRKVRCEAVIVRLDEAKGTYPRGMGLHFTEITSESRRALHSFLDH